jgi:uncharacterized protein (UPF0335 family)
MTTLQAAAQNQLRQFIEQIERLEEEKRALADDIRDKYAEAKALGFDVKTLRQVVKLRKKSTAEREEEAAVLDVYLHALGMLDGTPMGDFVKPQEEAPQATVRKAVKRLAELAKEDGAEQQALTPLRREKTFVSINGGPEVPFPSDAATKTIERWKNQGERAQ